MIVDQTHLFVILTEANKLLPRVKNRWLRELGLLRAVMGDGNIFSRLLITSIVVGILMVVEDRSRINTNVHVDCNVKRGDICHKEYPSFSPGVQSESPPQQDVYLSDGKGAGG